MESIFKLYTENPQLFWALSALALIGVCLLVFAIGVQCLRRGAKNARDALQAEIDALQSSARSLEDALQVAESERHDQQIELTRLGERASLTDQYAKEIRSLRSELAEKDRLVATLDERVASSRAALDETRQKMEKDFLALSQKILEEKSERFTSQNSANLTKIIEPLEKQLQTFRKELSENREGYTKGHTELYEQIKELRTLNTNIGTEAQNLINVLKGDNKKQGNWGEMVLENMLERTGLREGFEWKKQVTGKNDSGKTVRPDITIYLPENKFVVIDSKVTLNSIDTYLHSDDKAERGRAMTDMLRSVKQHIDGLSQKNYQAIAEGRSLDFVFMFVPVENVLNEILLKDSNLYDYAMDRRVALVTPTTLLFALRTIVHLWRGERQNKNAEEIAKKAGALYDKFVGFTEDLEKIGASLDQAQKVYGNARTKFDRGRGNLVRRTENLRSLGAKATKQLPSSVRVDEEE